MPVIVSLTDTLDAPAASVTVPGADTEIAPLIGDDGVVVVPPDVVVVPVEALPALPSRAICAAMTEDAPPADATLAVVVYCASVTYIPTGALSLSAPMPIT